MNQYNEMEMLEYLLIVHKIKDLRSAQAVVTGNRAVNLRLWFPRLCASVFPISNSLNRYLIKRKEPIFNVGKFWDLGFVFKLLYRPYGWGWVETSATLFQTNIRYLIHSIFNWRLGEKNQYSERVKCFLSD